MFTRQMWLKPTKYPDNVKRILFSLYSLLDLSKYAKTILQRQGMRWRYSFLFRYVTDKILYTLQVYYARSYGY